MLRFREYLEKYNKLRTYISEKYFSNCKAEEYGYATNAPGKEITLKKILDFIINNIQVDLRCFYKTSYNEYTTTVEGIEVWGSDRTTYITPKQDKGDVILETTTTIYNGTIPVLFSSWQSLSVGTGHVTSLVLGNHTLTVDLNSTADWTEFCKTLTRIHYNNKFIYHYMNGILYYIPVTSKTYEYSKRILEIEDYMSLQDYISDKEILRVFEEINKL